MSDSTRPPFDDVRAAFERLATPDKAAFVLEATFETIGQAITETGRRVSDAVSSLDLDALFRMDGTSGGPASGGPMPGATPPGPAPRPRRTPPRSPGVPPTDDAPPAK